MTTKMTKTRITKDQDIVPEIVATEARRIEAGLAATRGGRR